MSTSFRLGTFLICTNEHTYGTRKIDLGTLAQVKKVQDNVCYLEINKADFSYQSSIATVQNQWSLDIDTELIVLGVPFNEIKKIYTLPEHAIFEIKRKYIIFRKSGLQDFDFINEIIKLINEFTMDTILGDL